MKKPRKNDLPGESVKRRPSCSSRLGILLAKGVIEMGLHLRIVAVPCNYFQGTQHWWGLFYNSFLPDRALENQCPVSFSSLPVKTATCWPQVRSALQCMFIHRFASFSSRVKSIRLASCSVVRKKPVSGIFPTNYILFLIPVYFVTSFTTSFSKPNVETLKIYFMHYFM